MFRGFILLGVAGDPHDAEMRFFDFFLRYSEIDGCL